MLAAVAAAIAAARDSSLEAGYCSDQAAQFDRTPHPLNSTSFALLQFQRQYHCLIRKRKSQIYLASSRGSPEYYYQTFQSRGP